MRILSKFPLLRVWLSISELSTCSFFSHVCWEFYGRMLINFHSRHLIKEEDQTPNQHNLEGFELLMTPLTISCSKPSLNQMILEELQDVFSRRTFSSSLVKTCAAA